MDTIKFAIRSRYDDSVLYEADIPADTPSGLKTRVALEKATAARANLARANLDGANLAGANLAGANLDGANLAGAYLAGANLAGANLAGANLAGADLDGANLDNKKLIGSRPVFMIGPIGSRCAYFTSYITDAGIMLRAGCFFGTVEQFRLKLIQEHGENDHRKEYEAALTLIECHHQIWK